jgi:hypothetical protein
MPYIIMGRWPDAIGGRILKSFGKVLFGTIGQGKLAIALEVVCGHNMFYLRFCGIREAAVSPGGFAISSTPAATLPRPTRS